MKKIAFSCLTILLGLFFLFGIFRIVRVNKKYPEKKTEFIPFGKEAEIEGGLSCTVLDCVWNNEKEIIKKYGVTSEVNNDIESKTALIKVNIKNPTNQKLAFTLCNIYIEMKGYYNGLCPELFELENQRSMNLELKPGEDTTVILFYTIYKNQIPEKMWSSLSEKQFYIVNKRYPVKTCFLVS